MAVNERKDKTGKIKEVPLGLAEPEEKVLAECRAAVAGTELDDLRDATLARFLRNNSWVVEPSISQMKAYLRWRADNNVDRILDNPDFPGKDRIRHIVPYAYHLFDKEGRPIYIEKTGMIATAALADEKICPPDEFMHSHIYGLEMMQQFMYEESLRRGTRVNSICTILDMTGLGFHHRQCMFVLQKFLAFDKQYYPEYLGKLYVINTPFVAPYLYQAVQVFLDDVIKSRVQIIAGNPGEFLLQNIDAENLPVEYGGTCTGEKCKHGGCSAPGLKGCVDVLDTSGLKATVVSGLDEVEVVYDFEKEIAGPPDSNDASFTWYFEEKDGLTLDFSIELLPINGQRETDESKKVLVHKVERLSSSKGTFKAPYPGAKLIFRWDNRFSWTKNKNLCYTVSCVTGDSKVMDSVVKAAGEMPVRPAAAASASTQ